MSGCGELYDGGFIASGSRYADAGGRQAVVRRAQSHREPAVTKECRMEWTLASDLKHKYQSIDNLDELNRLLRENTNFDERRALRAVIRSVKERQSGGSRENGNFDGDRCAAKKESEPAAVINRPTTLLESRSSGSGSLSLATTSSQDLLAANDDEECLRQKLYETLDYDEKKKIRAAIRDIRKTKGTGHDGQSAMSLREGDDSKARRPLSSATIQSQRKSFARPTSWAAPAPESRPCAASSVSSTAVPTTAAAGTSTTATMLPAATKCAAPTTPASATRMEANAVVPRTVDEGTAIGDASSCVSASRRDEKPQQEGYLQSCQRQPSVAESRTFKIEACADLSSCLAQEDDSIRNQPVLNVVEGTDSAQDRKSAALPPSQCSQSADDAHLTEPAAGTGARRAGGAAMHERENDDSRRSGSRGNASPSSAAPSSAAPKLKSSLVRLQSERINAASKHQVNAFASLSRLGNGPGIGRVSSLRIVSTRKPPKILLPLSDSCTIDGNQFSFTVGLCDCGSSPTASWYKNGRLLEAREEITYSLDKQSCRLLFREVFPDDSGIYKCVVQNEFGQAETSARLCVESNPLWKSPEFILGLEDKQVEVGGQLQLRVQVRAVPNPVLLWYRGKELLDDSREVQQTFDGMTGTLTVSDLTVNSGGSYRCLARNSIGEQETGCEIAVVTESSCGILVSKSLNLSQGLEDIESRDGAIGVSLKCSLSSTAMAAQVTWHKDNKVLVSNDGVKQSFDGTVVSLAFNEIFPDDAGVYTCTIEVGDLVLSTSARLSVVDYQCEAKAAPLNTGTTENLLSCTSSSAAISERHAQLHSGLPEDPNAKPTSPDWFEQSTTYSPDDSLSPVFVDGTSDASRGGTLPDARQLAGSICGAPGLQSPNVKADPNNNNAYSSIVDEAELQKVLDGAQDYETRKKIRARLRELREAKRVERDNDRKRQDEERAADSRRKLVEAEQDKKRILDKFAELAKSSSIGSRAVATDELAKRNIAHAEDERRHALQEFQEKAKDSIGARPSQQQEVLKFKVAAAEQAKEACLKSYQNVAKIETEQKRSADKPLIASNTKEAPQLAVAPAAPVTPAQAAPALPASPVLPATPMQTVTPRQLSQQPTTPTQPAPQLATSTQPAPQPAVPTQPAPQHHDPATSSVPQQSPHAAASVSLRLDLRAAHSAAQTPAWSTSPAASASKQSRPASFVSSTSGQGVQVQSASGQGAVAQSPRNEAAAEKGHVAVRASNSCDGKTPLKVGFSTPTVAVSPSAAKSPSPGARGAMAAFKQLDKTSNPTAQHSKPNYLSSPSSPATTSASPRSGGSGLQRSISDIKEMLLNWCRHATKDYKVSIDNYSTSWNNGMAFCALIHHFYPDAFDFSTLDPKNRRYNFTLAFDTAEKYADIAPLLDVEDMVRMEKPDWKCVFTYVQSFYRRLRNNDLNKHQYAEN